MIRLVTLAGGVLFALGILLGLLAAVVMQHDYLAYMIVTMAAIIAAIGAATVVMGARSIIRKETI